MSAQTQKVDVRRVGSVHYTIDLVHISDVTPGDYVEHDGRLKTVGKSDIKFDLDLGHRLFGDCYGLGRNKVRKANIIHAVPALAGGAA